jgi:glycerol-1-phosphate dehydrogenase [NAD(P)+]
VTAAGPTNPDAGTGQGPTGHPAPVAVHPPTARATIDLAALRDELGAERRGALGLRRVIEGDGALGELAHAVAELPRTGRGVAVLAAATLMTVDGRDLRAEVTELLGRELGLVADWVTVGPPDGHVHADEQTVAAAAAAAEGAGWVVSVGSGTVTDIGKAAAAPGTPLVAVQTATSVNGYADPFSVLLRSGAKRTTPTRWPDTLLIDPAVLAGAPADLNRAGIGDLVSMFTSTPDWYLAGAAGMDPSYDQAVADLSRRDGDRLLALAPAMAGQPATAGATTPTTPTTPSTTGPTRPNDPTGPGRPAQPDGTDLAAGGPPTGADLAELGRILTLSGIAMGVAGATAPSSGMEHAISHLLEMADTALGRPGSWHGTQVGLTTIVATATWAHIRRRISEGALNRPAAVLDPDAARDRITAAFKGIDPDGSMAAECFTDYSKKLQKLTAGGGDPLAGLRADWARHDEHLGRLLTTPAQLANAVRSAGLPVTFADLPEPVDDGTARWAVANCALLRARFGVADLAMLLGCWQEDDIDQVLADATVLAGQP